MTDLRFYLLALDRTETNPYLVWWGPDRRGYTFDLNKAGLYDESEARLLSKGTDDPVPVEKELAEVAATLLVTKTPARIEVFCLEWKARA